MRLTSLFGRYLVINDFYIEYTRQETIKINGIEPEVGAEPAEGLFYRDIHVPLKYSGAMLIVDNFLYEEFEDVLSAATLAYEIVRKVYFLSKRLLKI